MLKYQVLLQEKAIGATLEGGNSERKAVYYPMIAKLNTQDTRDMVKGFDAFGNSAFTSGEITGVLEDLGRAISYVMKQNNGVHINGLGTFKPKVITDQSNVEVASKINASHFNVGVNFTPDSEFLSNFRDAEWEKVSSSDAVSVNNSSYQLSFQQVSNNASLKFVAAPVAIMNAWDGLTGATIKLNGGSAQALNLTTSGAYLETAIANNASLTNATAQIHIPAVTVGTGESAVTYAAADFTISNISQAGPIVQDTPPDNG